MLYGPATGIAVAVVRLPASRGSAMTRYERRSATAFRSVAAMPRDIVRFSTRSASVSAAMGRQYLVGPAAPARLGGRDVLTEPEHVRRIVAALDRDEPLPSSSRIAVAHPCLPVVGDEVHVRADRTALDGLRERANPSLVGRRFVTVVQRGDVDHQPSVTMCERRGLIRDARHGATEHAD